jgi:alkanesulfonate monooxygenase SsuD/methylene tetrahydromethanopterin reductase-like flavin-dependent oxidoreductase (luciferase family)
VPPEQLRERELVGSPETIRQRLAAYEEVGAQEVLVYLPDAAQLDAVRLFAHECMARLR